MEADNGMKISGSCACGGIKFIANPKPRATVYCYCTTCRKCSGAEYLPFVHFRTEDVQWESDPDKFNKSDIATRTHCAKCGSSISMYYHSHPDIVAITLGCIDEGLDIIKPVSWCIFVKEKPAWAVLPAGVKCSDDMSEPEETEPKTKL